jgi:hypothetical protein
LSYQGVNLDGLLLGYKNLGTKQLYYVSIDNPRWLVLYHCTL